MSNRTYVTFLLDRSGSMSTVKSQTIEGFNGYLSVLQAEENAEISFTFLQFDSPAGIEKIYVAEPVKSVKYLTDKTFVPRGGTPLIDAAVQTIRAVEEAIRAVEEAVAKEEVAPKVVICIQTDGDENESRSHNWQELSNLIKAKQEAGWQFNFMGAGIDAYKQAEMMGLSGAQTMSYGVDKNATANAFTASAQNSLGFATGRAASTAYTTDQKLAAGDAYDPNKKA